MNFIRNRSLSSQKHDASHTTHRCPEREVDAMYVERTLQFRSCLQSLSAAPSFVTDLLCPLGRTRL